MNPRVRQVLEEVAAKHGVGIADIIGPSRLRVYAMARFEAMYRLRQLRLNNGAPYSLPAIARFFGDRDHTTILHGIRRWMEINGLPDPCADEDDEALMMLERKEILARMERLQSQLEKAAARVCEIDQAISNRREAPLAGRSFVELAA